MPVFEDDPKSRGVCIHSRIVTAVMTWKVAAFISRSGVCIRYCIYLLYISGCAAFTRSFFRFHNVLMPCFVMYEVAWRCRFDFDRFGMRPIVAVLAVSFS